MPDAGVDPDDQDAGSPPSGEVRPEDFVPTCNPDDISWKLAPGFLLAQPVDYVEDRMTRTGFFIGDAGVDVVKIENVVFSSAGVPCRSAQQRERCLEQLAVATDSVSPRQIAATAGDSVRIWSGFNALSILGLIDTPAEALWWALTTNGTLSCLTRVERVPEGFKVTGIQFRECDTVPAGMVAGGHLIVKPNGETTGAWDDIAALCPLIAIKPPPPP